MVGAGARSRVEQEAFLQARALEGLAFMSKWGISPRPPRRKRQQSDTARTLEAEMRNALADAELEAYFAGCPGQGSDVATGGGRHEGPQRSNLGRELELTSTTDGLNAPENYAS